MQETIIYLDLTILVHTMMTALLLLLTARLCRRKPYPLWLAAGVLIGSAPILLWALGVTWSGPGLIAMGLGLPVMIAVGLRIRRLQDFARCFLIFAVLAAVSGGGVYMVTGSGTRLTLENLWIVPALMGALYGLVCLWQRWHKTDAYLQNVLFKVEMDFGWGSVEVPALLDTGNELKDPVTGSPVIVVEERAVRRVLPPDVRRFLDSGWQKEKNPWTLLWQSPALASAMTFVATESVGGKRLLPGIRPQSLAIRPLDSKRTAGTPESKETRSRFISESQEITSEIRPTPFMTPVPDKKATILLVQQVLSAENRFQALLHPRYANLSGRNSSYAGQEKSHVLMGKTGDNIRREMA
ncbi:MAG: sigma-E processing peptidase SpoIIGA [Peptococcaceae bacterium]|nr:sigma-E processing peptidase SpoIIGA [Peptococcaceae bacterium]